MLDKTASNLPKSDFLCVCVSVVANSLRLRIKAFRYVMSRRTTACWLVSVYNL